MGSVGGAGGIEFPTKTVPLNVAAGVDRNDSSMASLPDQNDAFSTYPVQRPCAAADSAAVAVPQLSSFGAQTPDEQQT